MYVAIQHIYIYIYIYIYVCVCVCVCEYIYIYVCVCVFTNLISTSVHGTRKRQIKPCQEQEIKVSRITAQGEKKKIMGQKERKDQPRPTP